MAPSDSDLVDASAATYVPGAIPAISANGVSIFVTKSNDLNVVAIEGSHDVQNWLSDFLALEVRGIGHPMTSHPDLGWIHAGFMLDAMLVLPSVRTIAQDGPYAICGHSLGAALALLLGGLLTVEGLAPMRLGAFAPPRVGGEQFANVIKSVPFCAYRFGCDIVPEVPFTLATFPYIQVPLIEIGVDSKLDRFACHNISNYVAAVHSLSSDA
jgi:hypothetical protein